MTQRGLRLGRMMVVVAIVAVDLVVGRTFVDPQRAAGIDVEVLWGLAPFLLVLHAALVGAVVARGRRRWFCLGFLAAGALSVGFALAANADPPRETTIFTISGGVTQSSYPGCFAARVVWGYHGLVTEWLETQRYPYIEITSGCAGVATWIVISLVPLCLIAAAGGLMAALVYTRSATTWKRE